MPKRKASAAAAPAVESTPKPKRSRKSTNPTINPDVLDGAEALRASPDASPDDSAPVKTTPATQFLAEESDQDDSPEEIQKALSRPPPVNSDYLPLPWKGRIGYACLCTYLRFSNPPVFSSRTCRIASILENRHPLANPDEPPHATKNRPDKEQPADVARGQAYVESLGLANARDIIKMIRWNDRYGIKFMRLSSEMFPFASHEEYGYKLDFAADVLGEAGKLIAKLGHRVTTHPGQYTQLGSPRKSVIDNAIRDLDYHAQMLDLLKMPPQEDRDAVMILHLGGVFGDKAATLDRFRANYAGLADNVKKRLVLENDDVSWSVHELLPICEELNIPMVLDYHHHNIIFDETQIREGTKDIMDLYPRILATWKKKNITPKMHYSEPTPAAITGRQRRKHSPRVATLPPCPPDMDLMIEAKDKEQAVFELMRTFKLPGYDKFNDILPHVRNDDNKIPNTPKKKKKDAEPEPERPIIPDDEVGMGGPEGRVYWPPGMEDWLRPVKRVVKKKEPGDTPAKSPAKKKAAAKDASETAVKLEAEIDEDEDTQPALTKGAKKAAAEEAKETKAAAKKAPAKKPAAKKAAAKKAPKKAESTPELTEESEAEEELSDLSDSASTPPTPPPKAKGGAAARAVPARPSRSQKRVSYVESQDDI